MGDARMGDASRRLGPGCGPITPVIHLRRVNRPNPIQLDSAKLRDTKQQQLQQQLLQQQLNVDDVVIHDADSVVKNVEQQQQQQQLHYEEVPSIAFPVSNFPASPTPTKSLINPRCLVAVDVAEKELKFPVQEASSEVPVVFVEEEEEEEEEEVGFASSSFEEGVLYLVAEERCEDNSTNIVLIDPASVNVAQCLRQSPEKGEEEEEEEEDDDVEEEEEEEAVFYKLNSSDVAAESAPIYTAIYSAAASPEEEASTPLCQTDECSDIGLTNECLDVGRTDESLDPRDIDALEDVLDFAKIQNEMEDKKKKIDELVETLQRVEDVAKSDPTVPSISINVRPEERSIAPLRPSSTPLPLSTPSVGPNLGFDPILPSIEPEADSYCALMPYSEDLFPSRNDISSSSMLTDGFFCADAQFFSIPSFFDEAWNRAEETHPPPLPASSPLAVEYLVNLPDESIWPTHTDDLIFPVAYEVDGPYAPYVIDAPDTSNAPYGVNAVVDAAAAILEAEVGEAERAFGVIDDDVQYPLASASIPTIRVVTGHHDDGRIHFGGGNNNNNNNNFNYNYNGNNGDYRKNDDFGDRNNYDHFDKFHRRFYDNNKNNDDDDDDNGMVLDYSWFAACQRNRKNGSCPSISPSLSSSSSSSPSGHYSHAPTPPPPLPPPRSKILHIPIGADEGLSSSSSPPSTSLSPPSKSLSSSSRSPSFASARHAPSLVFIGGGVGEQLVLGGSGGEIGERLALGVDRLDHQDPFLRGAVDAYKAYAAYKADMHGATAATTAATTASTAAAEEQRPASESSSSSNVVPLEAHKDESKTTTTLNLADINRVATAAAATAAATAAPTSGIEVVLSNEIERKTEDGKRNDGVIEEEEEVAVVIERKKKMMNPTMTTKTAAAAEVGKQLVLDRVHAVGNNANDAVIRDEKMVRNDNDDSGDDGIPQTVWALVAGKEGEEEKAGEEDEEEEEEKKRRREIKTKGAKKENDEARLGEDDDEENGQMSIEDFHHLLASKSPTEQLKLKESRRRWQNKDAAKKCRKRKQDKIDELSKENEDYDQQRKKLKEEAEEVDEDLNKWKTDLQAIKKEISVLAGGSDKLLSLFDLMNP